MVVIAKQNDNTAMAKNRWPWPVAILHLNSSSIKKYKAGWVFQIPLHKEVL